MVSFRKKFDTIHILVQWCGFTISVDVNTPACIIGCFNPTYKLSATSVLQDRQVGTTLELIHRISAG